MKATRRAVCPPKITSARALNEQRLYRLQIRREDVVLGLLEAVAVPSEQADAGDMVMTA